MMPWAAFELLLPIPVLLHAAAAGDADIATLDLPRERTLSSSWSTKFQESASE